MGVYEVKCHVEGVYTVRVLAESKEDALRLANNGKGVILEKDIDRHSTKAKKIG